VPAGVGTIASVKVVLRGFSHSFPSDVDVMLAGPTGQTVMLMSDTGGGFGVGALTLTFDDAGPALPTTQLSTGTFRPTNLGGDETLPVPAPAGPYGTALSAFNGTNPQGQWRLFVNDQFQFDVGSIATGWSLILASSAGADYLSTAGTLTIPPGAPSGNINVPIVGDIVVEPAETFAVNLSAPSGATIADGVGLGTITNDDIAFTDDPLLSGITPIKTLHILELRTAINAARVMRGLLPVVFTDPALAAGQAIKAVHISELRAALPPGCAPSFTDATLVPGVTPVKAVHIMELRLAVSGC
jgi:hypothetical protein